MNDPWRLRCPKGHSGIKTHENNYWCSSCEETYRGEPYDAKETEFPIDEEPRPKHIHDDILEELVRECEDPTTNWRRSRDLSVDGPRRVGRILSGLEDDGLVERLGSSWPYHWRPTEAGREQVIETEREIALKAGRRQRAQAHPAAIWLLGVVTSLLLMAAYAIATGVIVG